MCGKRNCDLVVPDIDIRMVIMSVRKGCNPVHEDDCVPEGAKTETLYQSV